MLRVAASERRAHILQSLTVFNLRDQALIVVRMPSSLDSGRGGTPLVRWNGREVVGQMRESESESESERERERERQRSA